MMKNTLGFLSLAFVASTIVACGSSDTENRNVRPIPPAVTEIPQEMPKTKTPPVPVAPAPRPKR